MLSKISDYVDFKSINSSVKYLSISALFTGIGLGYFFTLIVILAKYKGYTEGTIGIIAACFSLGLMSSGFIVSNILDKIGLYKTMSIAILIQTICVILIFIFFNPLNLAINHFIMGIFGGMIWMTMDTWVNLVSDNNNRGKAIGFYNSAITIGFAIGPLFVGFFGVKGIIPITLAISLMFIRSPILILIKKHKENIKDIKIIDVNGLAIDGSKRIDTAKSEGSTNGDVQERDLVDRAVTGALRYRAHAPVLDSLLKEVGLISGDESLEDLATGRSFETLTKTGTIKNKSKG